MNARLERTVELGRALVHEARTEKVTFMAGSLAYHAFISLLPLLLLVLAVITAVGNATIEAGFIAVVKAVLSPGASDVRVTQLFLSELRDAGTSASVSVLGLAVLTWGTLRIFRGLDTAFSDIYETEDENTFADQLADGVTVFLTFAVAVAVAGGLQRLLPAEAGGPGWWLAQRALLVVGLTLTFLPVYYVFPDTDVSVPEILPGTVFAAVGLTALEALFRFYTQFGGSSADSSLITGVLALLTWLYFSSLVILFGAVVNAVFSNRSADVNVDPVVGGVPPQAERDIPDQEAVVDGLTKLEARLDDPSSFAVVVDGEEVPLPPPQSFRTDTETDLLALSDAGLGLELRWSPRDESTGSERGDGGGEDDRD